MRTILSAAVILAVSVIAQTAQAAVVTTDPVYININPAGGGPLASIKTLGLYQYNFINSFGTQSGTASGYYSDGKASVMESATAVPSGPGKEMNSASFADVGFYLYVLGPADVQEQLVPLDITANATTSIDAQYGYDVATVQVSGALVTPFEEAACSETSLTNICSELSPTPPASFSGTVSLGDALVSDGQSSEGLVIERVSGGLSNGTETASFDPSITIDPNWLASNPGYSLVFSPDSVAVPEPFTLSLFGAGLAGAAAMRRRKKTPTKRKVLD